MSNSEKIQTGSSSILKATGISITVNILLSLVKVIVGLMLNSMALIADGIHSISDLITDLAILIGVHFGSKEADPKHPYGHGRIETFSAVFISIILLAVGLGMIYEASVAIAHAQFGNANWIALVVAVISIVAKESLYHYFKKVAIKTHSSALYANAWHQRSDALSSVAAFVGLALFLAGFQYGDRIAAIAVGIMIVLVAVHIFGQNMRELTEGAVDDETFHQIAEIIDKNPQIRHWHKLRTRTVGREVFLDLHILVDPDLDIAAAHEITLDLEETLNQRIQRPVNITIHIEPDLPEFRK